MKFKDKLRFLSFGSFGNWLLIFAKTAYALKETDKAKSAWLEVMRVYLKKIEKWDHSQAR